MHAHRVVALTHNERAETAVAIPSRPSGLGWLPDGTLLVISMADRRVLRLKGRTLTTYADLSALCDTDPNDMVVDAKGRAYIGTISHAMSGGAPGQPTLLIMVSEDGTATVAARDMQMANGMAITPDGRTLVVAETTARRLTAFAIASDGSLSRRRVFAALDGVPDGICLDAKGGVWVGMVTSEQFVRVLEGGRVTHRVVVAGKMAVAPMLGGNDRRTLYLCTAKRDLVNPNDPTKRVSWIESVRVETPGAGWP
ncbi:MAG: SMP-30/gluconolactonase/LRE family protein [Chloroflexi bacterium]|nr:SMP-30/gluconolactonase/LRE family protein [Chloroflexota bacterium]